MMLEYDRQAAESVSLTNTAEMSVSIVSTDSETVFEVWVQQGETSWKMEKEWADCLALQEALAEMAKMMGVKVPKLSTGRGIGLKKKKESLIADRKKQLGSFINSALEHLSMTNELNVFLEHQYVKDISEKETSYMYWVWLVMYYCNVIY